MGAASNIGIEGKSESATQDNKNKDKAKTEDECHCHKWGNRKFRE